jgi:hypothetical protein
VTTAVVPELAPGVGAESGPARAGAERKAARVVRRRSDADRLSLATKVAWGLLFLQLLVLVAWSAELYSRWSLTWDFAIRYQGWWGIANGNLDPFASVVNRYFWQDHFELINWPLAPLSNLWPGGLWPLLIQDVMVFGGEAGALLLVTDAARRPSWPQRFPGWVAVLLVTLLLVVNPWIYDSVSFDFHFQSVGAACFAMLACREMVRGNTRWLAVWVVLCLACGDIAGTYLAAVGLGGVLLGRGCRRRGAVLVALGTAWFVGVTAIGGGEGSKLGTHYAYLLPASERHGAQVGAAAIVKAILEHPGSALARIWRHRTDLWAYAGSVGGLGLLTPLSVLPLLVLFQGGASQGSSLIGTPYEQFGAVLFVAPLSVLALGWLAVRLHRDRFVARFVRRIGRWGASRVVPFVLASLMAANALVWAAVWLPRVPSEWLRVTSSSASTLDLAAARIPQGAEVVASQGVMGRLAGRKWCYEIAGGASSFPLKARATYFVIAPYQGIELASIQSQLGMIWYLAGPLHARLVLHGNGVWLFELQRRPGTVVRFPSSPTEPAWAAESETGTPVTTGAPAGWRMALSAARPGYLVDGTGWNLLPGRYEMTVTMSSSVTTTVQVWDSSADRLLAQDLLPATNGVRAVQSTVLVTAVGARRTYAGWGMFSFEGPRSVAADEVEVRIWTEGTGDVSVYSVEVQRAGG